MATTKTLTPTNQTITIAGFQGEKPDQRQVADAEGKLADAINALNSNKVSIQVVTETDISINAGEHKNFNVPYTSLGTVQAVFVLQTPNSAYIFGSAVSWSANGATIGLYNSAPSTVTGSLVIGILYK